MNTKLIDICFCVAAKVCLSTPCQRGGECFELYLQKDYYCTYPPAYKGKQCTVDVVQPYITGYHGPLTEGDSLALECNLRYDLSPEGIQFTWQFFPNSDSDHFETVSDDSSYIWQGVSMVVDQGKYTCTAFDEESKESGKDSVLVVINPPSVQSDTAALTDRDADAAISSPHLYAIVGCAAAAVVVIVGGAILGVLIKRYRRNHRRRDADKGML